MNRHLHWEQVHATRAHDQVSWFAPHLDISLNLIDSIHLPPQAAILDIGAGQSTLTDDLLSRGYNNLTLLDISQTALDATRTRLRDHAQCLRFLPADITTTSLQPAHYDLCHDRAVFHFLTTPEDRAAYRLRLIQSLKPNGHLILATFGPQGPTRCSGLDVVRYDPDTLLRELGSRFSLIESSTHFHHTPSGVTQQFLYCHFQFTAPTP